jgi:hypothetical protein
MEMFKRRPPLNFDLTATDVRSASAVWGATTTASLKGKTHKKMKSEQAGVVLVPRETQEAQWMEVDIFFIKKIPFLLGLMLPACLSYDQEGGGCERRNRALPRTGEEPWIRSDGTPLL